MAVLSTFLASALPDASAILARLNTLFVAANDNPLHTWLTQWQSAPRSSQFLTTLGALATLYVARIAYQVVSNKRFERRLRLSDGSRVPVAPGTKWYHKLFVGYFIRILTEAPSSVVWQERNLYSRELMGKPRVYLAHSFWGTPVLMVTDPRALYFIFSGRGYGFTKWQFTKRALVTLAGPGSMLVIDGEQHKVHRRLVNPLFNMSNLKRLVPYMEQCVDELYTVLDTAASKGNVVDFQELSVALTLNVIGRTALDTEFDALNNTHSPLHSAYNHLLESFSISAFNVLQGFLPFLRYLPIKRNRDVAKARDVTREQVTKIIQRIRDDGAQAASTSVPSLMRVLLENQKKHATTQEEEVAGGGKLSQEEIRDEALTFLVAGHETTSNALSMTLYFLAAYPDTQETLAAALATVPEHAPLEDLLKLEALQHAVNEGLRVHSPVFATNRMALADHLVPLSDGRTLFMPKGTLLVVPIQAMHYDPELFPNPHEFRPDRWKSLRIAGHDEADVTSADNIVFPGEPRRDIHQMQFLPFLAGSRACIGRNFALIELKLFLAGIVRRYRVRLPNGYDSTRERPNVHYSITARPEQVRLVFERRG